MADAPFSLEYRIRRGDGDERWVLDRGRAASADGRLWLEGVLIDATPERRMREELARMALHDALTGLPNRRALIGRAAREVALAASGGTAVSLVMLDVDHFKRVNDTFGHGVGDRVLVELASALRERIPDGGLVGRLGGEEFALLAPGVGAETLAEAGERIRAAGERVVVGTGPITLSAGGAALADGEDHESLIARADAALYRAKKSGQGPPRPGLIPKPAALRLVESRAWRSAPAMTPSRSRRSTAARSAPCSTARTPRSRTRASPRPRCPRAPARPAITTRRWRRSTSCSTGAGPWSSTGPAARSGPGDAILIPPGARHQITASDAGELRFLCTCAPPYRHEDTYLD